MLGPRVEWGLVHVTDWLPTLLQVNQIPAETEEERTNEGKPRQAAGVAPPEGLDGVGHWAELVEEAPLTRTELLYNYKARKDEEEPVAGLRWGSWKYLWSVAGFDGWQPAPEDQRVEVESKPAPSSSASPHHYHLLFDLSVDPEERNNLAEEQPQVNMGIQTPPYTPCRWWWRWRRGWRRWRRVSSTFLTRPLRFDLSIDVKVAPSRTTPRGTRACTAGCGAQAGAS